MLKEFKKSDIISRTFTKMRGEYEAKYQFTTHADAIPDAITKTSHINFYKLRNYLNQVFKYGYKDQELGCSNCKHLIGEVEEIKDDEIIWLANKSEYRGNGNKQHEIAQEYFLKYDPYTVCYELPVYNEERSGFIDLIRYKDDKVYICDLKPNAAKENKTKVLSQLIHYKNMLALRTGIEESDIIALYFDDTNIYQLKI